MEIRGEIFRSIDLTPVIENGKNAGYTASNISFFSETIFDYATMTNRYIGPQYLTFSTKVNAVDDIQAGDSVDVCQCSNRNWVGKVGTVKFIGQHSIKCLHRYVVVLDIDGEAIGLEIHSNEQS